MNIWSIQFLVISLLISPVNVLRQALVHDVDGVRHRHGAADHTSDHEGSLLIPGQGGGLDMKEGNR